MSMYFDAAVTRLTENLDKFHKVSAAAENGTESAIFTDGEVSLKLVYAPELKRFYLFRGEADCADDAFEQIQTYYYETTDDKAADLREAMSVANEFSENFASPAPIVAAPASSRASERKDRENDETSAIFFVNRIPGVLPECREPLLQHKAHYEMLLPNKFCSEVVNAAVAKLLSDKTQKNKAEEFFAFLEKMYFSGDMDVKSIITMTILNNISGEERIAYVEEMLSSDMNKAWRAARRFIGKTVKPEKETTYQQMSRKYREQIQNSAQ